MLIVGLTGGICCGKTTTANILKKLGAKLIDADKIAHSVIKPKTSCWYKIKKYFGEEILDSSSRINRKKLGKLVFANKKKLEKLEKITHPIIIKKIKTQILKFSKKSLIIIDAPLLFETQLKNMVDIIVVVKTPKKKQIERIIKRDKITKKEAIEKINTQLPLKRKIAQADYIINNLRDLKTLEEKTKKIWEEILNKKACVKTEKFVK